jgi:hyperosmotically inducible periplasmic protein
MGSLIRTVFVLLIVLIVGAWLLGYLPQTAALFGAAPSVPQVQVPSREEIKDRAARTAQRVDEGLADTALTTKIKAKVALDDTVKHADVSVHTKDGIVTLTGTVPSAAAQARLVQLARETEGVKSTVNQITIAGKG